MEREIRDGGGVVGEEFCGGWQRRNSGGGRGGNREEGICEAEGKGKMGRSVG